jgi:hypothetical protein
MTIATSAKSTPVANRSLRELQALGAFAALAVEADLVFD